MPLERFLIPALALSIAGMVWVTMRRARKEAPWLFADHAVGHLTVDESGITHTGPGGESKALAWDETHEVRIRTTDAGPLAEDVFWEFEPVQAGAPPIVVPGMTPGITELLDVAPDHWTGFDHEAVIQAMGSTENAVFQVWRRK